MLERRLMVIAYAEGMKEATLSLYGVKYVIEGAFQTPVGSVVQVRTACSLDAARRNPGVSKTERGDRARSAPLYLMSLSRLSVSHPQIVLRSIEATLLDLLRNRGYVFTAEIYAN